jgi:hypothetical protein
MALGDQACFSHWVVMALCNDYGRLRCVWVLDRNLEEKEKKIYAL